MNQRKKLIQVSISDSCLVDTESSDEETEIENSKSITNSQENEQKLTHKKSRNKRHSTEDNTVLGTNKRK